MSLAIDTHPQRIAMANELHARPFPVLTAPSRAVQIAIKRPSGMASEFCRLAYDHLTALLNRHGVQHPAPEARHYSGQIGRARLKWEMHSEFVTYTLFADGLSERPFSGQLFDIFPADWLKNAPGSLVSSAIVRIEQVEAEALEGFVARHLPEWFVLESLAAASVIDGTAVVASDFRLDENGHTRFAVLASSDAGPRRLGRVVQRLLEIETYKAMSMLTLPVAREVSAKLSGMDEELSGVVESMVATGAHDASETLEKLLRLWAGIEGLAAGTAFRFSAGHAYAAIVAQRIEVMRETRAAGKQLLSEFMQRRYDPAMRTCRAAEARLRDLSARAERAANLLRTRVDVAVANQNNELLRRMEHRAALQMRLQETVEGLSVVAVSYYGVSLASYLLAPLAEPLGMKKAILAALLTPPVLLAVWLMIRRIRRRATGPVD